MRGSALPFCFPSHTGAGQTSLWEPKLFRHMRNNLLRGHFQLNQTTASKNLQETYTHSVDEILSPAGTIEYSELRSNTETKNSNNNVLIWDKNFHKTLNQNYDQVKPYRQAAAGCVASLLSVCFYH